MCVCKWTKCDWQSHAMHVKTWCVSVAATSAVCPCTVTNMASAVYAGLDDALVRAVRDQRQTPNKLGDPEHAD